MNVLKHMEAVFIAALIAAGTVGFVANARTVPAPLVTDIATPTKMAVVTVTAKRPSAAQKLVLRLAERVSGSHA